MAVSEFTGHTRHSPTIKTTGIFLLALCSLFITACSDKKGTTETNPTSGKIEILADESFKPLLEAEKMVFEGLYKDAIITINYVPEVTAIDSFLNGKTELIFTGRPLTQKEKGIFTKEDAPVVEEHFATDGLAFLVNPRLNNSLISASQLKSVLNGKFKTWKELNSSWPADDIVLVFDQSNSANLTRAIDHFELNPGVVKIFAAGSNEKVVEYVSTHQNTIGVIGGSWLSDEESPEAKNIRSKVSILRLKKADGTEFYPFQASVSDKENPFARKIFLIRKNINMGVGAGFSSFVLSDRGQRIVLKAGLIPSLMPGREIVTDQENKN